MSCCGPIQNIGAFSKASQDLLQRVSTQSPTSYQFGPKLQGLIEALDAVDVRMREESCEAEFKPSQFQMKIIPFHQKPSGTEVTFKQVPLYFQDNSGFVVDYKDAGPEGGICAGNDLCGEIEPWQLPGDTFSSRSYQIRETAVETPIFCLRNLLHKENGMEYLAAFLRETERRPAQFFDNYIRNEYWNVGEKWFLHPTDQGPLYNTPDRVAERLAPNWNDFVQSGGQELSGLTLDAIQYMEYLCKHSGNESCLSKVAMGRKYMMVGTKIDFWKAVNEQECGTCTLVEGGLGFQPYSFEILNKIPFAIKWHESWFRVRIDEDTGEMVRIPYMLEYPQNGGTTLLVNQDWVNAKYGVFTIMEDNVFKYIQFGELPNIPGQVPESVYRHINPRFHFYPKLETCNYTKGLVQWRAEQ